MEEIKFSSLEKDISFLDFSDIANELLISSQNQIIWAPNGTGKTSIINTLKTKELPITFSNLETDNDLLKKNKKKLTIGLGIKDKKRLENENDELLKSIGIKDQLKNMVSQIKLMQVKFFLNFLVVLPIWKKRFAHLMQMTPLHYINK